MTSPLAHTSSIQKILITFYGAGISVHVLVLLKIIPFMWVNGGMSKTYEAQAAQSLVSIIVLSLLGWYVFRVSNNRRIAKKLHRGLLSVLVVFLSVGFFAQLYGTSFERYVMSWLLLIGIIAHAKLLQNTHQK